MTEKVFITVWRYGDDGKEYALKQDVTYYPSSKIFESESHSIATGLSYLRARLDIATKNLV